MTNTAGLVEKMNKWRFIEGKPFMSLVPVYAPPLEKGDSGGFNA
jgi:hypothetical protein